MLAEILLRIALAALSPAEGPAAYYSYDGPTYVWRSCESVSPPACSPATPAPAVSAPAAYAEDRPPTPVASSSWAPVPYYINPTPYYTPAAAYGLPPPAAAPPTDDPLVRDLIKVLDETKSKDTFCLALPVLAALKAEGRRAVPAVLRNAERLKISKGMRQEGAKWTREQKVVAECLEALVGHPLPAAAASAVPDLRPQADSYYRVSP